MNRLTSPSVPMFASPAASLRRATLAGLRESRPQALTYRLMGPLCYEANYAYPLLVWLHNSGDDEQQLIRIMEHVSLRNYAAVGPRGLPAASLEHAYGWTCELSATEPAWRSVSESIEVACKQYHVNRKRIFLAGLNDGGTMALRLALSQPEWFAGAASVGGPFPMNCGALSRLAAVRELPLLLMRGLESSGYPESQLCEEIRLFHAARMRVHLRQYTCGDELIVPMLRDLDSWMMEQVTGMPVLSEKDEPAVQ